MDKSTLVKIFGFPATLVHGDSTVLDRWLWIKKRLPTVTSGKKLVDIGCGTGAFTIGAGLRGYETLGLSWNERNQEEGRKRAMHCRVPNAHFEVCDIRKLGERTDLAAQFDFALCIEAIEHIVDDFKLMKDIATCLQPGGRLLLTTPFLNFRAMTYEDNGGADLASEDGGHVRRGYSKAMLEELCTEAGLVCEEISFCTGYASQKSTQLMRKLDEFHHLAGWALTLPLRPLVPLVDKIATRFLGWPYYSICLEAYKPRTQSKKKLTRLAA